jgi:site-specific DNA-cytosine methylase
MQKNYKGGNQLNPNYKSQANTIHNEDKKSGTICAGTHGYANGYVGDKHKPVKHTERNARHLKQLDDKSLCMTATMYKGAGNNGMTLVPQKLVDDTSDLPEKSQTIKSQYYKSSKANFEREGTFHATGIPQKQFDESLDKMTNNDSKSHKPKRIHLIPKEELNDFVRQRSVYSEEGKSPCLLARSDSPKIMKKETHDKPQHIGTAVDINGHDILKRVYSPDGKSPTVTACSGGNNEPKVVVQSYREVRTEEAKRLRRESKKNTGKDHTPFRAKKIVPREDGKVGTVTPGLNNDHMISLTRDKDQEVYWRKLTPLECERLQTVPDNYTNHVSNTQRYKMLGNGWTIEVIAHIFKNMEVTSMIIDKNVPVQKGWHRAKKLDELYYTINAMEIGDSIFFKDFKEAGRFRARASNYRRTEPDFTKDFVIRKLDDGWRVWRTQ